MGKGKKKKAKSLLRSSSISSANEFTSFQDEVIQHLQLLKEANGLVVGFNAVMRSIEKDSLCVVIYISRRGVSAMYHALYLMCKGKEVLFLQLQDINTDVFSLKIPSSTTYGIKNSVLGQPQFSKLLEKVNIAKNSRKNKKEKTSLEFKEKLCGVRDIFEPTESENCPSGKSTELCVDNSQAFCKGATSENLSGISDVKCFIHSKHDIPKQKMTGKEGMLNFQEIDFPNYRTNFNQISISIK